MPKPYFIGTKRLFPRLLSHTITGVVLAYPSKGKECLGCSDDEQITLQAQVASEAMKLNLWRLLGVPRLSMGARRLHFPLCQLASCCKRSACAPVQADAGGDTHHQEKRSCSARPFIVVMNRNPRFTWTRWDPSLGQIGPDRRVRIGQTRPTTSPLSATSIPNRLERRSCRSVSRSILQAVRPGLVHGGGKFV